MSMAMRTGVQPDKRISLVYSFLHATSRNTGSNRKYTPKAYRDYFVIPFETSTLFLFHSESLSAFPVPFSH
jgi:hypothetical protein